MCDKSGSYFHEEQHCVEINHLESVEDIEQPSLKISRLAFIMLQPESVDNIKQPMISKEISLQPCSYLQVAESGNHYEEEDMQGYFDLHLEQQQEVFLYSFIDPFVDYMESLSNSTLRLFFSNECWLFCSFEMHFGIPWAPLFIFSRSEVSLVSQTFVWIHWKHDFT